MVNLLMMIQNSCFANRLKYCFAGANARFGICLGYPTAQVVSALKRKGGETIYEGRDDLLIIHSSERLRDASLVLLILN